MVICVPPRLPRFQLLRDTFAGKILREIRRRETDSEKWSEFYRQKCRAAAEILGVGRKKIPSLVDSLFLIRNKSSTIYTSSATCNDNVDLMCVFSPLPQELIAMLVLFMTNGEPLGRNGRNLLLNRLALVCKGLHAVLAPSVAACLPALNRPITFALIPEFFVPGAGNRAWWSEVKGRSVTDAALESLAAGCAAITTLSISGRCVSDVGVACLARRFPALALLHIAGCRLVTDATMNNLALRCPAITSLDVSNCRLLSNLGVALLATGCRAITTLNLLGCRLVGYDGVAHLAAGLSDLNRLDLSFCNTVTDAALKSLANGCSKITTLSLQDCNAITNEGIACLAAKCTLIAILNVKACYNLTPVEHPWPEGFKLKI